MAKVFAGMSGGVDSSVTAALLVEQGHAVTGVYMKNWTQDMPGMRCPWADDLADAKRVAVQLGIPLKVYDFQEEYRQKVVDYMLAEYQAGRTPNPDVMCNQEVKFRLFLETALTDGAEMIATGHYARVEHEEVGLGSSGQSHGKLLRAVDVAKDQTYFLYRVSGQALGKTLFPLGEYTKNHVREIAQSRGLVTARKKDSQGICFVGSVGIREFLQEFVETQPGDIVDKSTNQVLGQHDGAIYYTLGQRHGLDIGGGTPYYVVGKNMERNEVLVSRNLDEESMWQDNLALDQIHWINRPAENGEKLQVRLRHRGTLHDAVYSDGQLDMQSSERAVAAGQSAVLYQGNEVLGGGIVIAA